MKNTKLLSLILKETNTLITSNEYKEAYSLGKARKLLFILFAPHCVNLFHLKLIILLKTIHI